jgi:cytoskeletal protein RodZ
MTHRFSSPTDTEIENLIMQVFASMPDADQSKLLLIENRLLQKARRSKPQKNLNKIPWWIVLVLAGGFASAAWWVGDVLFRGENTEITEKQSVPSDKMNERESGINGAESSAKENEQSDEIYEDRESPIIYQRESF